MPLAILLSQGDEVVTGQVVDSNAAWLAERLTEAGFVVLEHVAVRDDAGEIADSIRRAAERADLVLCTGGLGPTQDDLTAQAAASVAGVELALDPVALEQIKALYKRYQREMPAVNEKQAWLPQGARRLDNAWGTAPGFALSIGRGLAVFLPGVPREMKPMYIERVRPLLAEHFAVQPGQLVTLRTVGVGESNLQERLAGWSEPGVTLAFRTTLPENHVKLRFAGDAPAERVAAVAEDVARRLGSAVFAVELPGQPSRELASVVGLRLGERGETIATAESCTGGLIASWLTRTPGSSAWFVEGAVTYANAAKVRTLGVSEADLAAVGAVSEPVARQMALGMRQRAGTTWALSTTGIAGPGGGSEDKPVGTVHIALAGPGDVVHHRLVHLGGDRHRIQALTAGTALDLLRRQLYEPK